MSVYQHGEGLARRHNGLLPETTKLSFYIDCLSNNTLICVSQNASLAGIIRIIKGTLGLQPCRRTHEDVSGVPLGLFERAARSRLNQTRCSRQF